MLQDPPTFPVEARVGLPPLRADRAAPRLGCLWSVKVGFVPMAGLLMHWAATTGFSIFEGGFRMSDHDIVIRGGTVVDGTGGPSRRADVAVDGERISLVGEVRGKG